VLVEVPLEVLCAAAGFASPDFFSVEVVELEEAFVASARESVR
jgi:hypothetical protein